ncbi:MAG: ATP-binding cassette domain-containing protein, partial [Verrucomicrobiota bacterium]|nr:ATP-binding cassette domain-containing protein [Verrucomicrobiota bacterium]
MSLDVPTVPVTSAPVSIPLPVTGEQVLETEQLVKIYGGRAVVNGVNINVRAGEIVGLLGPNGAGKTTSFYMIVG